MRRFILTALVCVAQLVSPMSVQVASATQQGVQVEQQAPSVGAAAQADPVTPAAGLPIRAPQARTLRAHWHVFIAFAVTWVLLFGYALSIGRRFGRLEEDVRRLGGSA
jgi:CcmD family protein